MRDANGTFEAVKCYAYRAGQWDGGNVDPGATLVLLARKYMADHPSIGFSEAVHIVASSTEQGAVALRSYNESAASHRLAGPIQPPDASRRQLGGLAAEVHSRALKLLDGRIIKTYVAAVHEVLKRDTQLAVDYSAECAGRASHHDKTPAA